MFEISEKIKNIIISLLMALVVGLISSLVWCRMAKNTAVSDLAIAESSIVTLTADAERAVSASKSCTKVVKKLLASTKKKHQVIKNYKKKLQQGVQHEKIDNVNDFINYANGLQ